MLLQKRRNHGEDLLGLVLPNQPIVHLWGGSILVFHIKRNTPIVNISTKSQFRDRQSCFYSAWERTTDRWVLSTVESCYAIQFLSILPSHPTTPSLFRDASHRALLLQQVQTLCALGTTEEVSPFHWGKGILLSVPPDPQVQERETEKSFENHKKKNVSKQEALNESQLLTMQDTFSSQAEDLARRKKNEERGHQLYKKSNKILKHSKSKKEKEEAYQLLTEAADMGHLKAMEKLAAALLFGYHGPQNITAAVTLYETLAEKGSHKGQTALGFMFSYGIGMEYNQAKALVYYTFGSLGGNLISQMILGYRYWVGINVPRNCEAALTNYRKVAYFIADKLEKNEEMPVEKVRLMEKSENLSSNNDFLDWDVHQYYKFLAERGDTQIQVFLGQLHLTGRKGLEKDHSKAFYYFLKAAKAGNTHGMAFLGKMFLEGSVAVTQSNASAFKYFTMAAEKGNAVGLWGLGLLYFQGKGVPVLYRSVCELGSWSEKFLTAYFAYQDGNIDSSLIQYALLAEMGYEVAQSNSAYILESEQVKILSNDQMYPLALLLWNRAAAQGNAFARVKTGDYHFYGYGTKRDYVTAAIHYSLAVDHHIGQAMFNLAYMYEHGLGIPEDIHLAKRWYDLAAQTSPDASIPVFLARMKLEVKLLFSEMQLFKQFTSSWKMSKLDTVLRPHWDLFALVVIVILLVLLIRNR
ncbi:protein sel-1 homolog 2 isoform X5 [Dermochelys coriacea]|uniref:protein sel-1 homolog 2 isoform X5 n=1 Tax=Dermochelys coriacea TaxID=27794 RepID=UPI001CA7DDE2|nr:protein sel-1 homolog 2 isoform X5 [Dermochelys coriacea]